jgi:hypothetical protein
MPNLGDMLGQLGLFAKLTMAVAVVAFGLAVVYVFRPTEQKLVLMRPVSLAAIFATVSGLLGGWIAVLGTCQWRVSIEASLNHSLSDSFLSACSPPPGCLWLSARYDVRRLLEQRTQKRNRAVVARQPVRLGNGTAIDVVMEARRISAVTAAPATDTRVRIARGTTVDEIQIATLCLHKRKNARSERNLTKHRDCRNRRTGPCRHCCERTIRSDNGMGHPLTRFGKPRIHQSKGRVISPEADSILVRVTTECTP